MRVYTYNNEPEARKAKHLLEAQGVPCEIHSFENWGYDGIFRGQMGMGEIIVPDHLADRAKEAIDKFIAEERDRAFEGDIELRRIKLEQRIGQLKALPYVIYITFMVFAYFLIFNMGMFGIIGVGLLIIGVIYGTAYVKKESVNTKRALDKIRSGHNF